jgi:aspartate aminotransferase-like enzyme
MAKPMISHRGEEFEELHGEIVESLKKVFQTRNDLFVLSGSGTCAMEAAIGNLLRQTDGTGKPAMGCVTIANGKFGERFMEIAERYGAGAAAVTPALFEWGQPVELERVKEALDNCPNPTVVTMVHNETSVGMLNPAREVGKLAKQHDAIFVLDCITSIGGDNVPVDELGVDIAIVGSQKCLGTPPGLAAVSISEKAWGLIEENPRRPYYQDLVAYRKSFEKNQTPYTPAVPLFFALHEALEIIKEEGLAHRIERHRTLSKAVRAAVTSLGPELFPRLNEVSRYSNTVTAFNLAKGISDEQLRGGMKKRGVTVAGGQEKLKGKIFRIATMGNITGREVLRTIKALEAVLLENKVIKEEGIGSEEAKKVLSTML